MSNVELQILGNQIMQKYFYMPLDITIRFHTYKKLGGRFDFNCVDDSNDKILINTKLTRFSNKNYLIGTVKHELIHYYLWMNYRNPSHNQQFLNILHQIGGTRYAPHFATNDVA